MNKEILKAWRTIYAILQETGYVEMYQDEITTIVNFIKEKDKEIEKLNKIRQQVIDELFELKDMIYKPETREINFDVQRKISSMIVKLGSDKE